MRKDYIVAGHRFSIILDDASPLWDRITLNYGPFEAEADRQGEDAPIFSLYVKPSPDWSLSDTSGMEPSLSILHKYARKLKSEYCNFVKKVCNFAL